MILCEWQNVTVTRKIETDELLRIIFNQFRNFKTFKILFRTRYFSKWKFLFVFFLKARISDFLTIRNRLESFGIRCLSFRIKCLLNLKLGRKYKQFICTSHLNHFRSSDRTFIEHLSELIEHNEFYLEICPIITGHSLQPSFIHL